MVRLILSFLIVVVIFAAASAGCIQPPAGGSGGDQPAWPQIVQTPHPTLIPTGAVDPTRYRYVSNFSKVLYQINILEDWGLTQEGALAFDAGMQVRYADAFVSDGGWYQYKILEDDFLFQLGKAGGLADAEIPAWINRTKSDAVRFSHHPPVMGYGGWTIGTYGTVPDDSENLTSWISSRMKTISDTNDPYPRMNIIGWAVAEDGYVHLYLRGPLYPQPETKQQFYEDWKTAATAAGFSDVSLRFAISPTSDAYLGGVENVIESPRYSDLVGVSGEARDFPLSGTITAIDGRVIASAYVTSTSGNSTVITPIHNYSGHLADVPIDFGRMVYTVTAQDRSGNLYTETESVFLYDREKYPDW